MKRILLVKTSSLGDVVHNLPVATDIRARIPDAEITWVVEDAFEAVPKMHPAVRRVLPVSIRRWRKTWWRTEARREIAAFRAAISDTAYDAIVDTQGLFKSAILARMARGPRFGLNFASSREPLAVFYDRTFEVPWSMHAVERNRSLAAQALGYDVSKPATYGISAQGSGFSWLPEGPYAVLLHATSAPRKLWPEPQWIALARSLKKQGVRCVLPWGNEEERQRSQRLASDIPESIVPPLLRLDDVAVLLSAARVVVGVDTGLAHLAVALGVPTVGIYCATDPAATGLYGVANTLNVGTAVAAPTLQQVNQAIAEVRK
jgi:heptosyltransferase-1